MGASPLIAFYFRSSSLDAYLHCQHRFFLNYNLGIEFDAGDKAKMGTIVHKAMELMGRKQLCRQNGEASFTDEDLGKTFLADEMNTTLALDLAWAQYSPSLDDPSPTNYKFCAKQIVNIYTWNNGAFTPEKRDIVALETFFDLELPWATYDYELQGEKFQGNVHLRGTIDCVTRLPDGTLEVIDYKTGTRKDLKSDKVLGYDELKNKIQTRVYHYALSRVFNLTDLMFTYAWTRDGGPITLFLTKEDLEESEEVLRRLWVEIQHNDKPKLFKNWFCRYVCPYAKHSHEKSGLSLCEHYEREVYRIGALETIKRDANLDKTTRYGSAGGKREE